VSDFDVVVVGSGMSGGWVAKEMSERGYKVAVIERGQEILHGIDYKDFVDTWDLENFGEKTPQDVEDYPIQSELYAFGPTTRQYWVKDGEYPYETPEGQDFKWRRGHHKGGRSIMWGRQSYRFSETDFEANKKDGHGVDWPVRYDEIKPWYDHVERFAGISGTNEGLDILPDGIFQPPFEFNCVEVELKKRIEEKYEGRRRIIPARVANLTAPTQEQTDLGRGRCQARNHCDRGCSFGAYFSSNSATLPAAERTGNCTMLYNRAVLSLEYDSGLGRAVAANVFNSETGVNERITFRAVFLNASTITSAIILLNSSSSAFPNGLANSSGQVGRNLMDHMLSGAAFGIFPGFTDMYFSGRRPSGFYIPRFRNHTEQTQEFVRGYGFQGGATRVGWNHLAQMAGMGEKFKNRLRHPGPWVAHCTGFGEILPNPNNQVRLHASKRDKDGLPVPVIDAKLGENDIKLYWQMRKDAVEILETGGCRGIGIQSSEDTVDYVFGDGIHEMGTARMGHDPATSVLNKWNQSHDVSNLFITDGSFMASAGCQNPSLTYMAFSARAADHASDLLKSGAI